MFHQAKWDEPLIIERSASGKKGHSPARPSEVERKIVGPDPWNNVPRTLLRNGLPPLPELSEPEVVRHYTRLSQENFAVDLGIYPLGSCTMKYNPKVSEAIAQNPKLEKIHPEQDESTVQGTLALLHRLDEFLAEITGMSRMSLQPVAGAAGEYLGALIMRAYHKSKGELETRREMIIPDSAHGTNPASAAMAGFNVVVVPSNSEGTVDLDALHKVASPRTAGLMITNPNTLGIFEKNVLQIAGTVHDAGGLLYYDGANFNAILGKVRPGDMGFDIVHLNLHKTFATPHGGGGPGSGPVVANERLLPYLPIPRVVKEGETYRWLTEKDCPESIGRLSAFMGN